MQPPFHWKHFSSERKASSKWETETSVRRREGHTNPRVALPRRFGFTYLRLKDNYMELLNRDNDVER